MMSDSQFRAVLDSIQNAPGRPADLPQRPARVTVLGTGPVGLLLACEALVAGLEVRLSSLYGRDLGMLREAGAVTVRGEHLVGSYTVAPGRSGEAAIELVDSVDEAVDGADVIFIATPAASHTTYAGVLARALVPGQSIVLVPGRFLGSVAVVRALKANMAPGGLTVAELEHPPYLATSAGAAVRVLAVANTVSCASLPVEAAPGLCAGLADVLGMLQPVDSPLDTAFSTITGVLNVAPLANNAVALEAESDALLRDLVTPGLSRTVLRQLDEERRAVAFRFGVRDPGSAAGWLLRAFGDGQADPENDDLATAIHDLEAFDDVLAGWDGGPHVVDDVAHVLVPLASAGRACGVPTPITDAVVAMASSLAGTDLGATGRTLDRLGLGAHAPSDVRRALADSATTHPMNVLNRQAV